MTNQAIIFNFQLIPHKIFQTYRFWLDPQYTGMIAPLNWETISVCIFPGFIAAGAGAVEAVMTMEEVNDRTETENESPNQYLFALSLGNAVAALYGTIGGGANIPMSVLALEAGANGRFRISGIVAGCTVFLFVMVAAPLIKIITVSSLVGLMVAVIIATMDWGSIWFVVLALLPQSCREHPKWLELADKYPDISSKRKIRRVDAIVIVIVWIVTIVQDLFVAVAAGVAVTALAYAWDMGERFTVTSTIIKNGKTKVYTVHGPVFFASTQRFVKMFRFKEDPDEIELHFDRDGSELVDYSALHAINVISNKYKKEDKKLTIKYLGERAEKMLAKADAAFTFEVEKNTGKTKYTPLSSLSKECGDRVNTSMGHGTIVEVRKNGQVCVVRLDWELANSGQATMIVETNNLL
jgi:SulP family sulfate permease